MAFEELTERHAAIWGSAPFENIAELISEMHVTLVDTLVPGVGEEWLDLGCGAGDVAFLATRHGAVVTGSDLSPALVDAAKRRAVEQSLELTLEVADCQNLPYADASYDVVSSSVGVIFAPDHARAASELARVCRPGGRVGITAWRASSGVGEMFTAMAPFMPPPVPGAGSPLQWGEEDYVASLLGDSFDLRFSEHDTRHTGTDATETWIHFRDNFGPAFTLWTSLDEERRAEFDATMIACFDRWRTDDGIDMERRYLVATGVRKME